jgi:hypothetical protein
VFGVLRGLCLLPPPPPPPSTYTPHHPPQVIALLNTCGVYFSKGTARRRLDRFLTFLSAYVAAKDPLPLDIENDLLVRRSEGRRGGRGRVLHVLCAA